MRSDLGHIQYASVTPIYDSKRPAWFDDDSEWEYEYDENETDEFFFTLDLSTHIPESLTKREVARNGKRARGNLEARKQKISERPNAKSKEPAAKAAADTLFVDQSTAAEVLEGSAQLHEDDLDLEAGLEPTAKVQFVGLDTASPYVVYNNIFHSAYWISDNGTQVWISEPGVSESALYKGYALDVVGMSQTRLVLKPADLASRTSGNTTQGLAAPFAPHRKRIGNHPPSKGPLSVPKNMITDPASEAHADFMERFSRLKWRLGQRDSMQTSSIKTYVYPSNAQEIRDNALQHEANADELRSRLENRGQGPVITPTERRKARKAARTAQLSDAEDDDYEDDEEASTTSGSKRRTMFDEVARKHEPRVKRLASMGLWTPSKLPQPRRRRRTREEMAAARARGEK